MDVVRRFSLLVTAALFGAALIVGAMHDRPVIDADAASQLARSTSYFDSTIVLARNASPRGPRGDAPHGRAHLSRATAPRARQPVPSRRPGARRSAPRRRPRASYTRRLGAAWPAATRRRLRRRFVGARWPRAVGRRRPRRDRRAAARAHRAGGRIGVRSARRRSWPCASPT